MRIHKKTLLAADANGIALTQSPAAAGNLVLAGAEVTVDPDTGVNQWLTDTPRVVSVTSDGNDSGNTFTVTGENQLGQAVTEDIAGPDGTPTSTDGTTLFRRITSIAIDGVAVGNITVGTTDAVNTSWIPVNTHATPVNIGFGVFLTGATATYTVQHTFDDVQDLNITPDVFNHAEEVGQTTSQDGNYAFPIRAMRLSVTGFSAGTIEFGWGQAGLRDG